MTVINNLLTRYEAKASDKLRKGISFNIQPDAPYGSELFDKNKSYEYQKVLANGVQVSLQGGLLVDGESRDGTQYYGLYITLRDTTNNRQFWEGYNDGYTSLSELKADMEQIIKELKPYDPVIPDIFTKLPQTLNKKFHIYQMDAY